MGNHLPVADTDRLLSDSALVLCSQVISLSTPRKSGLRFLKYWLYGSNDGEGKGFLTKSSPEEILAWSDDHDRDFVAIRGESDGDSSGDVWTSKIVTALLRLCTPGRGKVCLLGTLYDPAINGLR